MMTAVEEKFSEFYEKWMCQLEDYVRFLVQDYAHESDYENLVAKMTTHHKDYYKFKWAAAREDVCAFFSPVWLSPLEKAYLWITGWKPSTVFRLVESLRRTGAGLVDLTEEQVKRIELLRGKIRLEEEKVEREMERQQVGMADRKMVELADLTRRSRCGGGGGDGTAVAVDGMVEVALKGLMDGLERVMKMGDCVRLKTLKGLLDVMNPKQCVALLAAQSMLQLQLKEMGEYKYMSIS